MPISIDRCQELFDYLETMRLPMESPKAEIVSTQDEEKTEDNNSSSPTYRLNDPSIYSPQIPFLIYDENKETIISRTTKGVNEGKLNPFEVDWGEVTLYETHFVRDLLEDIDTHFVVDVAQAIDDEDKRHAREDGQYTNISSGFYGTGQGSANFYSYMRDNWHDDGDYVSAVTIAEGILDKRNKAKEYRKKIDEIKALRKECDEWKAKATAFEHTLQVRTDELDRYAHRVDEAENSIGLWASLEEELDRYKEMCKELESKREPEMAFNSQTGTPCFTSRQMGILLTAVGRLTEKENPPGKTTLGKIVERIAGYKSTTAGTNMKGAIPQEDTEAVARVIESKFPNLAMEVRKL